MELFKYKASKILSQHGLATPAGDIASTSDEAERICREIDRPVALKS